MIEVTSPDGRLELRVRIDDDRLRWEVRLDGNELVVPSNLGVRYAAADFSGAVEIEHDGVIDSRTFALDRPSGKQRTARATATVRTVVVTNAAGDRVALELAVFDDAVAHRFRQLDAHGRVVTATSIGFPDGSTKFVQPIDRAGLHTPASEALYTDAIPVEATLDDNVGWSLPALFETPAGWVLVTETGVGAEVDGSRLHNEPDDGEHRFAPPTDDQLGGPIDDDPAEPYAAPWQLLIVSSDLGGIVASNAVELLAPPSPIGDTSWIRPGRVSWSWWSESDSPRNPERLTDFIDFAAEMGWEYSLIDANWNLMPDGTIERLVAHAADRNVGLFLWYNSGGPHNVVTEQPRDRMHLRERRRQEMRWLVDVGVVGLKVDFFHSDRASMNRLALEMLEDAAEFGLLMNFHGITSPKGWHATWPHLLTTEAVRGAEQYKFAAEFPETAPRLNTTLAFTRNVVGPMDYTPITVSDVDFPHLTTTAHELALGVVFESGLQHPADAPEAYRALGAGALDFLGRLPVVWDELCLLEGRPGSHVVLARRHGDEWWIGGINGTEESMQLTIDPSDFGGSLQLITDGPAAREFELDTVATETRIVMAPRGGFVAWP